MSIPLSRSAVFEHVNHAAFAWVAGALVVLPGAFTPAPAQEPPSAQVSEAVQAEWKDACIKLIRRGDDAAEAELKALLLPLAEAGNATAQLVLSLRDASASAWFDKAVEQEDNDALWIKGVREHESHYWVRAENRGHVGAKWEHAYAALRGWTDKSGRSGFMGNEPQLCRELAEQGHVMAQCALAAFYRKIKDDAAALEWGTKAAEQGDAVSMWYLSLAGMAEDLEAAHSAFNRKIHSLKGREFRPSPPPKPLKRPFRSRKNNWEKRMYAAADCGYFRALASLGDHLYNMIAMELAGVDPKNMPPYTKASLELFYLVLEGLSYGSLWSYFSSEDTWGYADERDKEYLQRRMKGLYDNEEAWAAIESLAKGGHVQAAFDMGIKEEGAMRRAKEGEAARHREAAIKWYKRAVRAKHVAAHERLGILLLSQSKSDMEACRLLKFAADKGMASAKYRLGLCYLQGRGTAADPQKALKCFAEAAEKWEAGGLYELAMCYYDGNGVKRDVAKAKELIDRFIALFGLNEYDHSSIASDWHIKDRRNPARFNPDEEEWLRMHRDVICLYLLLR